VKAHRDAIERDRAREALLVDARKLMAAGLLARGGTQAHVSSLLSPPVSVRTLRRWLKEPAFQAEMQRVQENAKGPDPEGVLLDALSATTDDGIRWDVRVKSAIELRNRPQPGSNGGGGNPGGGMVSMTVHQVEAWQCVKCGHFDLKPPEGWDDDEIEDAEIEEITSTRDEPPLPALGTGIHGVT
jgi:hypothetical protein